MHRRRSAKALQKFHSRKNAGISHRKGCRLGIPNSPYPSCETGNIAMSKFYRADEFDLNTLLHPARAFEHPMRVVEDPDLTLSEKRAILAAWASDACAVAQAPAMRLLAGASRTVEFDDVMDALRELDLRSAGTQKQKPRYRRVLENRRPGVFGRKRAPRADDQGPSLH
jgi:hypothetical protein